MTVALVWILVGSWATCQGYINNPLILRPITKLTALESTRTSDEYITVEIRATSKTSVQESSTSRHSTIIGYQSLYDEVQESRMQKAAQDAMRSPVLKLFGLLLNPTTLLFGMYFSGIAWGRVQWLQRILKIFGKGTLVTPKDAAPVKELPFQTFECENCGMEMRPARGRAEVIFGRPRFRCSRCGAKASSYFDVDDLNDPRAVARLERLEAAKNSDSFDNDENDDDEDEDA